MTQNKTRPTTTSPTAYIKAVENERRRKDARVVYDLMRRLSGERARMWGPSIIGFGYYKMTYDSGREVENMLVGFSPRKQNLVLYIGSALDDEKLVKQLGKYKRGKGCLYINKLDDIDLGVLESLVERTISTSRAKI